MAAYVLLIPNQTVFPIINTPVPTAIPTAAPQTTPPTPGSLVPPGPGDWTQPGHDSGHSNAASQDAGPLTNAKVKAIVSGAAGSGRSSAPLAAQGRAILVLNRVLNVYDLQTGGAAWPGGAPGTGQLPARQHRAGAGRIYAATTVGLTAFNLADGRIAWTQPLTDAAGGNLTIATDSAGSPSLYLVTDHTLRAFGEDGTPGWTGPDLSGLGTVRPPAVDWRVST